MDPSRDGPDTSLDHTMGHAPAGRGYRAHRRHRHDMRAIQPRNGQLGEARERDRQRRQRRRDHGGVDRSADGRSHDTHIGNGNRDRADDAEQAPLATRTEAVEAEGARAQAAAISCCVRRFRHYPRRSSAAPRRSLMAVSDGSDPIRRAPGERHLYRRADSCQGELRP
jgi:hypothetical protein